MAGKKRLETVVARNGLAARIVAQAGTSPEVDLDWLAAELSDARRFDIVAALKELEAAGAGAFVVGRRGKTSRFVWSRAAATGARSSGAGSAAPPTAAASPPGAPSSRPPDAAFSSPAQTLRHAFHLRKDTVTILDLPADITRAEVDRLCGFLQAIPFD